MVAFTVFLCFSFCFGLFLLLGRIEKRKLHYLAYMYCMHFPPLRSSLRRYCDGSSHLCMLEIGHTCILQSKKAQPGYTHIEVLSDACTAALSPLYFCKLGKQELYEVVYKAGSMMKSKLAIRCHLTPLNCLALAFSFFFPRHCLGLDLILSDEMNTQPPEKPRVHCAFAFYSPHQLASSSKLHRYMCVYLLYPLVPPSSVLSSRIPLRLSPRFSHV